MDKHKKLLLTVFSILLIIFIYSNFYINQTSNNFNNANNSSVIKVLIFDGDGAMESSVQGIEECLNESNNQNISNRFEYSTTSVVNSSTLYGYDVLIMPGGDASNYVDNENINSEAIKLFVKDGKGYLGICAGAYAASNSVDGYYYGWGITPDVNTKNINYEGTVTLTTTSFGSYVFNGSLTDLHMENGPSMYSNSSQNVMAYYADNKTGYQNFAAIVGETYGSGRIILSGPHPELEPRNSKLLAQMVRWVSAKI